MIAECKLLDRIGVSLPAASKELLQQVKGVGLNVCVGEVFTGECV